MQMFLKSASQRYQNIHPADKTVFRQTEGCWCAMPHFINRQAIFVWTSIHWKVGCWYMLALKMSGEQWGMRLDFDENVKLVNKMALSSIDNTNCVCKQWSSSRIV